MILQRANELVGVRLLHPLAKMPEKQTEGASGFDLVAIETLKIKPLSVVQVRTGVALNMLGVQHLEAQVRTRSGLSMKHGIFVINSPGTIDNDYVGEIKILLTNVGEHAFYVKPGMRIAQLVFNLVSPIQLELTHERVETVRGDRGFGSTGV